MRFLVDAQLPPATARWLDSRGYHAVHVQDLGLSTARDLEIWRHAQANNQIIVTKDEDFARLAIIQPDGPRVIWLRIGNTTRRQLLDWLDRAWPGIDAALHAGERLIKVVSSNPSP